ncbi:aldose 1-epimerase [Motilibacter peucedani]|uniref:Aldose 1-epimerase n=1 Tax=Motilibacter peucedani TaxID=598650 RepID=A0A420XQY3_9ACTN|nr:aldose epimerase family protein [Motilibacter peucedani]RKS75626.1 aldose 1-epimerase [Motilibacter peucedani]
MTLDIAPEEDGRAGQRLVTRRAALVAGLGAVTGAAALAGAPAAQAQSSRGGGVTVSWEPWGTYMGQTIRRYTLANQHGMAVRLLTYGATVQSLDVPDKHGEVANVALGFDNLADYVAKSPYFGATIGRYGNRIRAGGFTLDGHTYPLPLNNGLATLHGGFVGWDKLVWSASTFTTKRGTGVLFSLVSPDGDQGFPGTVHATASYELTSQDDLELHYTATTDMPTVINMTNHTYFNLGGEGTGTIEDHLLKLNASRYTPVDVNLIPTGALPSVHGTPFDFTTKHQIGERIDADDEQLHLANGGYDHNWVLDRWDGTLQRAAWLRDPDSGRTMMVETTEPGIQFYSGNFLDGSFAGTSGQVYRKHDALTLETQHFPDSPNQPSFPSTVLRPGQTYDTTTVYRFKAH